MKKEVIEGIEVSKIMFPEMEQIMDNCYLIKKGVRSAYLCTITAPIDAIEFDDMSIANLQTRLKEIEEYAKEEGLFFYAYSLPRSEEFELDDEESACVWIYKYPHQGQILRSLKGDHSFLEEWIVGKLLGYSDESMEAFLKK